MRRARSNDDGEPSRSLDGPLIPSVWSSRAAAVSSSAEEASSTTSTLNPLRLLVGASPPPLGRPCMWHSNTATVLRHGKSESLDSSTQILLGERTLQCQQIIAERTDAPDAADILPSGSTLVQANVYGPTILRVMTHGDRLHLYCIQYERTTAI